MKPFRGVFPANFIMLMQRKRHAAFTLVELMLVVAILVNLAIIAMPSFIRARKSAQNARFSSDLRAATTAFEMYAAENNKYPPDAAPGIVPTGMSIYLQGFNWTATNTLGGSWAWDHNSNGLTAGIAVILPGNDHLRMTDIDTQIDNGILTTGGFRKMTSTRYAHIIE